MGNNKKVFDFSSENNGTTEIDNLSRCVEIYEELHEMLNTTLKVLTKNIRTDFIVNFAKSTVLPIDYIYEVLGSNMYTNAEKVDLLILFYAMYFAANEENYLDVCSTFKNHASKVIRKKSMITKE